MAAPPVENQLNRLAEIIPKYGFDGVDVHEAWDFEAKPGNWLVLETFFKRLQNQP